MTSHSGKSFSANNVNAIDCVHCGFVHQDPIPNVAARYREQFYAIDKPNYLKEIQRDLEWLLNVQHRLELVLIGTMPKTALDVGCGSGVFLRLCKTMGCDVEGVEPDDSVRAGLQKEGLSVYADVTETGKRYDLIRLAWVMEHLSDPAEMIAQCRARLSEGGKLLLVVPNDFSPPQGIAARKLGKPLYWLHDTHVNYWNTKRFEIFLNKCDLRAVLMMASFPMEWFLLMGQNYLSNPEVGEMVHAWRKEMELTMMRENPGALIEQSLRFAHAGIGRDLFVVAE